MTNQPGWKIPIEDCLVMRGATLDDADPLSAYNGEAHHDPHDPNDPPGPAVWISEWTRDLISKPHPSMSLDDVIVVEDSQTGQIVSSCVYFQQTWSYGGVPVPFGRPELVSTHPDYRNRGLIRRQFELMHRWGDERGHLVQGITGIPYYYRQFGYEMALEMAGSRRTTTQQLPQWKDNEERDIRLRPAERADVEMIASLRKASVERSLFVPLVDKDEMEYQLFDRDERSATARTPYIIENQAGTPIGFLPFQAVPGIGSVSVSAVDLANPAMYRLYTKSLLKCFRELLEAWPDSQGRKIEKVALDLLPDHPIHPFLGREIAYHSGSPYAWYIRVPDMAALIKKIAPALEKRLQGTAFEGLSGRKQISFYRTGLRMEFENGKMATASNVEFPERHESIGRFPGLSFLQLLFGQHSVSELDLAMVDASASSDEDEALLNTLFPKMSSDSRFATS